MEEFIVSALKYRPLNFDSVVGQRSLTTTLKNAISSGKLAHAYLFCGPRGVGKTTCARIFAKAINCFDPQEGGEPCGKCESCQAFDQQRSMNIHELDAASNNSVDDIRELCKQVLIPPQTGKYKVFIIDEVHMLSPSAFNAFLKTLEEPPSYVIFILCTTEKHKILPTILSRCQVYDFQRMTTKNTIEHLAYVAEKEGYKAEPEALALIAEKADGGMRDALSIFDQMVSFSGGNLTYDNVCQNLNVLSQEYYFQLVDFFLASKVPDCLLLLNDVLQKGFDGGNFVAGLATHMRNLLVSKDAVTLPLLEMSEKMRSRYQEQAQRCPIRFVYKVLKLTNDCDQAYRTSRNKRLQVEICLIQCAQASEAENAEASGHSPAETIKPIKKVEQATSAVQPADAPKADVPKPATQPASAPKVDVPKTATLPVKSEETPRSSAESSTLKKLPKVSFKHFGAGKKEEETVPVTPSAEEVKSAEPINQDKLDAAWYAFIVSLPHESVALAGRLKGLQPAVKDDNTAVLPVSNPQVQQTVESLMPQILSLMKLELRNFDFRLETKLEEMQEVAKSYSPQEMLKEMQKQNADVGELVNKLGLTFES
ncbi:MAG: DNA polymerase III subunit gamma/tau [Bacteroidaceae bacterium]|nr:DNA polymerase III subunit gamma/tau [Bacteroidaceae bacterium]